MAKHVSFTTEQELVLPASQKIDNFWHTGEFGAFVGVDTTRINYAVFNQTANEACLVIVPGRSESYLKYRELAYDWFRQGYNVFIIEHRGQGLSQRMLANPHQGYVASFDSYVDDLHTFVNEIVLPRCKAKPYLLAHSMGGTIAIRYFQRYPNHIKAAVLSSPMIAFNAGGMPNWLTIGVVAIARQLNHWFSNEPWYFFGQSNYQAMAFQGNPLTHSATRFELFSQLYQSTAQIQLGGVTIEWLYQAIVANKAIFAQLDRLNVPILVVRSGADTVVDNAAQDQFCAKLHQLKPQSCPDGRAVTISNAFHELFIEADEYRQPALVHALSWFNGH